jgi:hypothetical protein
MTKTTQSIIAALLTTVSKICGGGLLLALGLAACKSKEVKPKEFLPNWADYRSEVTDKQAIEGMEMRLTYNPTDLLILNELEGTFSQSRYNKSKQNFCAHYYFTLDIVNTPLSKKTGEEIKKYFVRDRQSQFSLLVGTDSIPCALYHPEMMSDADKLVRLNLVFPRPVPCDSTTIGQDLTMSFREDKSPLSPVVRFVIKGEKINQIPKIKF